ncbi:MAG: hypothetical protein UT02_C0006G0008 [Parcubacteria group bacterium GW2011_GWC2_38_7]|nr:MAG: hypothetical protein UT02_C0006G0008 [Parcubacteria group bacterium GW2011_GWC2_38_7]
MAQTDNDQQIIEKMETAYADFSRYMDQLEAQATDLVKQHLKELDKEKISDVLNKIKSITQDVVAPVEGGSKVEATVEASSADKRHELTASAERDVAEVKSILEALEGTKLEAPAKKIVAEADDALGKLKKFLAESGVKNPLGEPVAGGGTAYAERLARKLAKMKGKDLAEPVVPVAAVETTPPAAPDDATVEGAATPSLLDMTRSFVDRQKASEGAAEASPGDKVTWVGSDGKTMEGEVVRQSDKKTKDGGVRVLVKTEANPSGSLVRADKLTIVETASADSAPTIKEGPVPPRVSFEVAVDSSENFDQLVEALGMVKGLVGSKESHPVGKLKEQVLAVKTVTDAGNKLTIESPFINTITNSGKVRDKVISLVKAAGMWDELPPKVKRTTPEALVDNLTKEQHFEIAVSSAGNLDELAEAIKGVGLIKDGEARHTENSLLNVIKLIQADYAKGETWDPAEAGLIANLPTTGGFRSKVVELINKANAEIAPTVAEATPLAGEPARETRGADAVETARAPRTARAVNQPPATPPVTVEGVPAPGAVETAPQTAQALNQAPAVAGSPEIPPPGGGPRTETPVPGQGGGERMARFNQLKNNFAERDANLIKGFGGWWGVPKRGWAWPKYQEAKATRKTAYEDFNKERAELVAGQVITRADAQIAIADERASKYAEAKRIPLLSAVYDGYKKLGEIKVGKGKWSKYGVIGLGCCSWRGWTWCVSYWCPWCTQNRFWSRCQFWSI